MSEPTAPIHDDDRIRPPLGSWSRLYGVVLLELALLIVLFTWFTRAFS